MPKLYTGAEIVFKCLQDQDVDFIFGYPGGAVLPIYDELKNFNSIKHILVRHEQGAGHAAEGLPICTYVTDEKPCSYMPRLPRLSKIQISQRSSAGNTTPFERNFSRIRLYPCRGLSKLSGELNILPTIQLLDYTQDSFF